MFFKQYTLYENKLSQQLEDDNPYKKKLIQMETPSSKHPIYSTLVLGLLIYSWIFFVVLFYTQINQSALYNLKLVISTCSIVFVTLSIRICYKKDYIVSNNFIHQRVLYIIFFIATIISILIASLDSGDMSFLEILQTFCIVFKVNDKSYIALVILLYITLGITLSYHTCPYIIYRVFYSVNKTHKEYVNEKKFINKCMPLFCICFVAYLPLIYTTFNPAKDNFAFMIKNLSTVSLFGLIPLCILILQAKRYYYFFEQAIKYSRRQIND